MNVKKFIAILCFAAPVAFSFCNEEQTPVSSGNGDSAFSSDDDTAVEGDTDADTIANDTDTIPDPFEAADCTGAGLDPVKCEYEWCKKRSTYIHEWEACAVDMTPRCAVTLDCYDSFLFCLEDACPLGTDVPVGDDKTPIYTCDNDFTICTMAAEVW